VLIAQSFGLSTCPIGLINAYEDDIKELLDIPDNKDVVIGIALGYGDAENPVNQFKTPRDSIDSFVKFID
jgi:nitroreductase